MSCGGGMQGFGRAMFYAFMGCSMNAKGIGRMFLRVVMGGGGGMMSEVNDLGAQASENELVGKS